MNQVLFSSVRAHVGRLIATGIAVTLSVAFVVTTLLLSSSYRQTMVDGLTAQMDQADLQVAVTDDDAETADIDEQVATALEGLDSLAGVAAADAQRSSYVQVASGARRANASVEPLLSAQNRWQELSWGDWPSARGEVTMDEVSAEALGVTVGDTLRVTDVVGDGDSSDLAVVGLTSTANAGFSQGTPTLITTETTFEALGLLAVTTGILVSASEGVSPGTLSARVAEHVDVGSSLSVFTREEAVEHQVAQLSGTSTLLTSMVLVFGAVSLLVSGFVIANTFRVLVAQRTGELALLRCIGAGVAQVYRLILLEAGIVGLVFSAAGAAIGIGTAAALVSVSASGGTGLPLSALSVPPLMVVGSIACGTVVTTVFALGPARNATKVRPIVALRPLEAVSARRVSTAAAVIGPGLTALGAVAMVYAARRGSITVAVAGGLLAGLGVLVASSVLLPVVTRLLGMLISPVSAPMQLAAANVNRNRRRTATTGAALLIGSILLAMLTTGVSSVRESVVAQIDDRRPIDIIAETAPGQAMDTETIAAITHVPGVVASAEVLTGAVDLESASSVVQQAVAEGVDQQATSSVAHSEVSVPQAGSVHVSPNDPAARYDSQHITARGASGETTLEVVVDENVPEGIVHVASSELVDIDSSPDVTRLQLRLEDGMSSTDIQSVMTDISSLDEGINVSGGAQERAYYNQILDTMLMVVLGLLAVAVVIAFVGIGNTAALSVIERRRESALLRTVGLGRGQLMAMICTEAGLTAIVSTALGLVTGVLLGWAGITTLGQSASEVDMTLHVPWGQLAAILAGATTAGTLAALLPAYAASRRRPVEDLAAT
ncbi:FtsX-like permease family protein [Actinomyces sp. 2119]|uniref:ABC transporter permease n=1 Tax=Actinomyces sp. 2119 TaxID=2321393 RepID=UPI000E6C3F7D|nr:ABC transporter permease [Actinomyces sp. 2119]RJF42562.1 FtsX-like permease family protein [Actinomyces sp. 2119]